jgi:hypothetical protein
MEGSGTCGDVCRELGIRYEGRDLKHGFDATRSEHFEGLGRFDFIWMHPPYFQMVRYNPGDPRCLSSRESVRDFVAAIRDGGADAVLAASIFHRRIHSIGDVKAAIALAGMPVRLVPAAVA